MLCQILITSNYTAHAVFNGKEALAAMQRESYDMVLMDVFMPVMDGIECTRELRRLGFQCPVIAVSATINEEACLAAGMTGMLPKPITKASVLRVVESYLRPAPN